MDTDSANIGSMGSENIPDSGDFYAQGDSRIPKILGKIKKRKLPRFKKWRKKNK